MENNLKIGNILINAKTALAPMAAVNCKAFRMLCKNLGTGLIFTPMIDSDFFMIKYKENKTDAIDFFLDIDDSERPIASQIVGSDKENLEKSAKIIENYVDIIDLNLGCPNGDILGKKAGAYFIKHPQMIIKTFSDLIKNSKIPITAKIRSGWDKDSINALEVTLILQKMGISAVTIHARTRKQKYTGKADWEIIKKVKQDSKITIPIIGNGDITKAGHAKSYLERNYCDMVMIGRYAKKNPHIFKEINNVINNKNKEFYDKDQNISKFKKYYKLQKRQSKTEFKDHINWLR